MGSDIEGSDLQPVDKHRLAVLKAELKVSRDARPQYEKDRRRGQISARHAPEFDVQQVSVRRLKVVRKNLPARRRPA